MLRPLTDLSAFSHSGRAGCAAHDGQRLAHEIGIDDQFAVGGIHGATGERGDERDIALENVAMEAEKVSRLFVIRIGSAAGGDEAESADARERVGHVLAAVEADRAGNAPEVPIDLEVLGPALEPLTLTEKQVVWFETMGYSAADAARMLRMSPQTADKIGSRAGELVRGSVDAWSRTLLTENGASLGREAAGLRTKDCLPAKAFLDSIDGRTNWRGREEMERHVRTCWHCLDHFCRLLEVVDVLRASQPLAEAELQSYQRLLGIQAPKRSLWKKLAG